MTEKYVYKNQQIQELMNEIHFLTGSIVHSVQKLEYKLALLVSLKRITHWYKKNEDTIDHKELLNKAIRKSEKLFANLNHQSFGILVRNAIIANILDKSEQRELHELVEKRNFLVHNYYKKLIFDMEDKNIIQILKKDLISLKNVFSLSRRWYLRIKEKWIDATQQYSQEIK
ncbi:hypothetical protein ACJA25_03610 [Mycoplasmopsis hyopharyngis]|uniref:hypothetical protein n=1 Tax=Mycoplasmopsis hyopharyngis TaxID=29558 RepID=UPI0038731BA9